MKKIILFGLLPLLLISCDRFGSGRVKNIDVDNLKQELFKHSQWQTKRKSKSVKEIETHYRKVMGL